MIDNVSLQIEEMRLKNSSYEETILDFMDKNHIYDPEDIWEILDPILKDKIKQEYQNNNHFPRGSKYGKKENLSAFFD